MLHIYRAQIRRSLIGQFQYRFAMMIWMIDLILQPIIYLVVWSSVANSQGGEVNGFTAGDFAAYYIILMVVQHATQIWHMWEYEYFIKTGLFSTRLLRPLHPIHEDIASNLSYKFLMLMVVIPAFILMVILFRPAFNTPLWAGMMFIPALILAGAVAFLTGWTLAMAAFWTTRTYALNILYFVAMLFFSGQLAPLELMPQTIQSIAAILPFRWIISYPVELFLGRLTQEDALTGLLAQGLWIGAFLVVLHFVWQAAVKRYSAVGA